MPVAPPRPAPSAAGKPARSRTGRPTLPSLLRWLALVSIPIGAFLAATSVLPQFLASRTLPPVAVRLRSPEIARAAALTLARYAQSDPVLFPPSLDYAWLPDALNVLRHGTAEFTPEGGRIEFGGGFHHFGYELTRDPKASTSDTNTWHLSLYHENDPPEPLLTLHLARSEHVSSTELLAQLTQAYTRQLSVFPGDERAHRGRIQTLLRFGKTARARQAVRDMYANLPENPWAALLHALLLADEHGLPAADATLEDYVQRHPDFFRFLDLAYFHQLTDRPGRAADAVRRAAAQDVNIPANETGDTEFRGFSAAMHLYRSGQFEVARDLCDQLLPAWINGEYAKPALRNLRQAAEQASHGTIAPAPWPAGLPPFQPFADLDLPRLLGRPFTAHRWTRPALTP